MPVKKTNSKNDPVNPDHYHGDLVMRVIEYFKLDFPLGNGIKYILRAGDKILLEETKEEAILRDLKKARWYIDRKISQLENNTRIGNLK